MPSEAGLGATWALAAAAAPAAQPKPTSASPGAVGQSGAAASGGAALQAGREGGASDVGASEAQAWANQVAQQGQATPFPWASPGPMGGVPDVAIGSYLVQFVVVLALLLGLLWFSGQMAKGKLRQGQLKLPPQLQGLGRLWAGQAPEGADLRLEARLPLDAERTAYVLACEGQRWLLAGGPGALTVVAELEGDQSRAEAKPGGFASALDHRGAPPEGPTP